MAKKKDERRLDSTKQYIDALSEQHSRLNIVRVDLGYTKPHSENITLEDANKDLNRMFNNMRSKPSVFKDKVGYVCKKEYTEDKGLHIHAIFIYDGQKVQKDAFKGDEIGKYWQQITQDKGSFHNCNRNKYEKNGIGMLDHRDSEKRKILDENVLPYLCKEDQSIDTLKENKKDRAFTRGIAPKNEGNVGRPRNEK
jgi:hypothetical protein